jgi:hypothetical protein
MISFHANAHTVHADRTVVTWKPLTKALLQALNTARAMLTKLRDWALGALQGSPPSLPRMRLGPDDCQHNPLMVCLPLPLRSA